MVKPVNINISQTDKRMMSTINPDFLPCYIMLIVEISTVTFMAITVELVTNVMFFFE